MNRTLVAKELLAIARELVAIDFPTQDAMDKYLKEHPDADKSNHKVVKTKKTNKPKSQEKLDRFLHEHISTHIRDSLLHTDKVVTEEEMLKEYNKSNNAQGHMGVNKEYFHKVWEDNMGFGGLEKVEGGYKWMF